MKLKPTHKNCIWWQAIILAVLPNLDCDMAFCFKLLNWSQRETDNSNGKYDFVRSGTL